METMITSFPVFILADNVCRGVLSINSLVRYSVVDEDCYSLMC